jgi:lipid II:glycine glycyltransferase (peptidoglycan interpeptide bridge formation enzyme)
MNGPLSQSVIVYNELKDRIAREFGLEEDDQALLDTLEGETDLQSRLIWLARQANEAEEFATAMKAIMADNKARRDRFEAKAEKLRSLIAWAMQEVGLTKIAAPDVTLSLRMLAPQLVTTTEAESVPDEFRKVKVSYTFDKDAIKAAINNGQQIEWAHYGNASPSLTIRTR